MTVLISLPHPSRLQQDPSLLPSEGSTDGSFQERQHHSQRLPTSPQHPGSPEASDCSTETERAGTRASTPEISVSSDSEFESWEERFFFFFFTDGQLKNTEKSDDRTSGAAAGGRIFGNKGDVCTYKSTCCNISFHGPWLNRTEGFTTDVDISPIVLVHVSVVTF